MHKHRLHNTKCYKLNILNTSILCNKRACNTAIDVYYFYITSILLFAKYARSALAFRGKYTILIIDPREITYSTVAMDVNKIFVKN